MLRSLICVLLAAGSLMLTAPTIAADADAAKQPSSARVISYTDVKQQLAQPGAVTILDLRRNSDYNADTVTMPGARRFDPDKIAECSGTLPKDKEIVLFCAHEIGRAHV